VKIFYVETNGALMYEVNLKYTKKGKKKKKTKQNKLLTSLFQLYNSTSERMPNYFISILNN